MSSRERILEVAREVLEAEGFEAITVALVCERAGVSNGSFFHAFQTKDGLAAQLWLDCLVSYHDVMIASLKRQDGAEGGIKALVRAHVRWVEAHRQAALLIFRHAHAAWRDPSRDAQAEENSRFRDALSRWRLPLVESGALRSLPDEVFTAFLIGPAQILCRAWLDGRSSQLPSRHLAALADGSVRALVAGED